MRQSNVHMNINGSWEDAYFDTVEEAISFARAMADEYEDGGYWYDEGRGFWGRYVGGDYPYIVTIGVFDGMGESVTWRTEEDNGR